MNVIGLSVILLLILTFYSLAISAVLYLLLFREISFKLAHKLTCVAMVLNKLLFSGTGYLASSYFFQAKQFKFSKALSAFIVLEFFVSLPWVILGFYFGGKMSAQSPGVLAIIFLAAATAFLFKKNKIKKILQDSRSHFTAAAKKIVFFVPLITGQMIIFVVYYLVFFKLFGYSFNFISIIRFIAISFTVGYLSPAPAGIGFKEAGMIYLLKENGLDFSQAALLAVSDRIITTIFWLAIGLVTGFDIIQETLLKKLKNFGGK
jgi:uncharacterized protein (TIRG00374 family)